MTRILPRPVCLRLSLPVLALLGVWACSVLPLSAQLVANGGFEEGKKNWSAYVPASEAEKNCQMEISSDRPHTGQSCALLSADGIARYGVCSTQFFPVHPKERYRVSYWARIESGESDPASPGFLLRLVLNKEGKDAPGGHLMILPRGVVIHGYGTTMNVGPLPTEWTKSEAVIEIPPDVEQMGSQVFMWRMKGKLFIDDILIEPVDAETPITPLS